MTKIAVVIIFFSTLIASRARAEKPNIYAMAYEEFTFAFTKKGVVGLPTAATIGLGLLNPLKGRVAWYSEIELTTPITVFNPAPRVLSGPNVTLVQDKLYLSIVALYQFNPSYGEIPYSHLVGGGFDLLVSVSDTVAVGLVVGSAVTLGTNELDPSITIAPNVSFTLF